MKFSLNNVCPKCGSHMIYYHFIDMWSDEFMNEEKNKVQCTQCIWKGTEDELASRKQMFVPKIIH